MMAVDKNVHLHRYSQFLQEKDKNIRKEALDSIKKLILDSKEQHNEKELLEIWEILHKPIVRTLNDPVEACRESVIEILKKFYLVLPVSEKHIVYLIPILTRRLGSQELIEPSEEVRLKCILLLKMIVEKYRENLTVYFEDLVTILSRTVTDNYPKVKKESCECISEVAKIMPRHFYTRSENFIKGILGNFTHQHYRIRMASVYTIGDVLQYGNSKLIEQVATPLAQRLFDQSGVVRSAVIDVAGKWCVELRDRYSWWFKLIPLLLTGLHDEIQEIREKAAELWDAAGRRYLEENKCDEKIKNKLDFLSENLEHYPSNMKRPNLGCRIIVQENLGKLMNGIAAELDDWLTDIKIRSAQLLCVLIFNAEQDVTQHIEKLLPMMYRACNDEDTRVVENVELAAEYMGYFIPPNTYCPLVLLSLEGNPTSGHLRVFAAILRSSEKKTLTPELENIGNFIQQSHICQSRKSTYRIQILNCCESLITVCEKDCITISKDLFKAIFHVLSMSTESPIQQKVQYLLDQLVFIEHLQNKNELYLKHIKSILIDIESSCASWIVYTPEFNVFRACVIYATNAIAYNLDIVLPIFERTMNSDADPEMRLKQFILLSEYLDHEDDLFNTGSLESWSNFVNLILDKAILPGLIWSAGRTAEALRTASVCCLCALLNRIFSEIEKKNTINTHPIHGKNNQEENEENYDIRIIITDFEHFFEKIIPILVSLMDDNSKRTRLYSLRAVYLLMNIGKKLKCVTEEYIHRSYPVILKRLDDGCDDVRCGAIETLQEVWSMIPKDYNLEFNKNHVDMMYTTAIIHLDDPEIKFQKIMLDALMELGKVHPELLIQKLEKCRSNFRNQQGIEYLLNHIKLYLQTL